MSALFPTMSAAEYLVREERCDQRHEYDRGVMYAMGDVCDDHMLIVSNLTMLFHPALDETPCQFFMHRMLVTCSATSSYFYPDVVVTCGERAYEIRQDGKTLLNPIVLIEISSESTKNHDRGRKREVYQQILTLTDYLIVSQDEVRITHHTRREGVWSSQDYTALTDEIVLTSIGCTLPLARVYKKVTWA